MGYRRPNKGAGLLPKRAFVYDADNQCPNQQPLHYRTTNRLGYREYASNPGQCKHCTQRDHCTRSQHHTKVITRHVWQEAKEQIDAHRLEEKGKHLYARRKETVERSFADAKQLHGHRYARYRGLAKVRGPCLLAGACQNMKKMAMLLAKAFLRLICRLKQPQLGLRSDISLFNNPLEGFMLTNHKLRFATYLN